MTTAQDVQRLYIAYFSRPADPVGLAYWVSQIDAGQSIESVANNFALSPEYASNFTGATAAQIVNALYINLFGRAPELDGLLYWATELTAGTQTIGKIALSIALGAQDVPNGTQDLTALNAKISASESFTTAIDTADEVIGYSGAAANAAARAYLAAVIEEATLATATAAAALNDSVAAVTSLGGQPGQTFELTTGLDTIVGTAGNDTINGGTLNTISAFDNIDGGAGNDTATLFVGATTFPGAVTIKNVETLNVNGSGAGYTLDSTGFTGLTQLNLTTAAVGAVDLTLSNTTAANVVAEGDTVTVTGGGGALSISTDNSNVNVGATGTNAFTSVSVVGGAAVVINDNATSGGQDGDTLTAVTIDGATGTVDIAASGLTTLNASNLTTATTVTNVDLDTAHALALTLNGVDVSDDGAATAGTVEFIDAEATSVALATTGARSFDVTLTAAKATAITIAADERLQLDALTAGVATTVAISGDSNVTVSSHTLAATAAITSTSTGNVTFTGALAVGQSYTGGTGVDTITLSSGGTKAISTGAGNDVVTYGGALGTGGSIDAGAGTDTLSLTAAQAVTATATTTFAGTVSNFEVLSLSAATGAAAAINLANADGINSLSIAGATVGALTVTNAAANFTLTQRALTSFASSVSLASDTGTSDNVNLVFSAADGFTNSAAFTIANVESLTISTVDTDSTANTAVFVAPITATSASTVTVSGAAGISLIGGLTHAGLVTLDASGLTGTGAFGGLTFTSGALTSAATIKGGAAGTNTVIFSAATEAVTYTGGTGADNITGSNGQDNVVSLGNGTNSFTSVGAGDNTVTGGTGVDTITVGTGSNTISAGAGNDVIHIGASAGLNTVDVGTGTDTVILDAIQTAAGFYTSVTGLAAGDIVDLSDVIGSSAAVSTQTSLGARITLGGASSFANYLDAATAADGKTANTVLHWFQFNGNTYIVEDTSAAATFQDGADSVIELVGLVDLSTAVVASGVITLA